ncbi:hypothetical protein TPHA_0E00620 [Tetrapisispora phaffii CBS 4417]|uniref:BHLH domain-containing protein n=1 Tax=Tetrapisispora phaffii (strain ATCC 24235 / CBS 4417 / NBRC 1672 / NRRL Y-8282 / UCD 70-5) TaxID=1071381 RepID=G8BTC9_TETPH|nr:hypothetical protein TPHA_0E00620 [Tetrapisispora phaffii CBS 4417]CCE63157.1 hypothetical protein TPHA_0E00620 [Tetrapisispora phaffii CBS 4417]
MDQNLINQYLNNKQHHDKQLGAENNSSYNENTPSDDIENASYNLISDMNYMARDKTDNVHNRGLEANNANSFNLENMGGETRFLDDIFANSNGNDVSEIFNSMNHQNSISNNDRIMRSNLDQYNDNIDNIPGIETTDFLFAKEAMQPGIDLASSLGSSIHSDINSGSYQPQAFSYNGSGINTSNNSFNVNNTSNLNSMRSLSTSLRTGNYLSSSLRQPSLINPDYNNAMTPSSVNSISKFEATISPGVSGSSSAAPSSSVPNKMVSHMSAEEKRKRKREFHNAVERRRRELIKEKIKELGKLVPPSLFMYDAATGKKIKANKGTILYKTVEYLEFLKNVVEAQHYRKKKLLLKLQELNHVNETDKSLFDNSNEVKLEVDDNSMTFSTEKIIDARVTSNANPHLEKFILEADHNLYPGEASLQQPANTAQYQQYQQSQSDDFANDNLNQYLSGALIEAEDNAQLTYNVGQDGTTPADYLLEFDAI